MNKQPLSPVQADIIFKALYYVTRQESLDVSASCETLYTILAERNPNETHVEDIVDVMEVLNQFIRQDERYAEVIAEEEETEDE